MQRAAVLLPLRRQGNLGTIIDPHRSIATVRVTNVDLVVAVCLTIGFSAATVVSLGPIGSLWTWMYTTLAKPLGFSDGVALRTMTGMPFVSVTVPYFLGEASAPSPAIWWITLAVTALVLAVSFAMRGNFLPLAYILRLFAFVQATSLAFFRIAPDRFPYTLPMYTSSMQFSGMGVMVVVPVLLGLTFYLIDVGLVRKIGVTVAMIGHLVVFIPLQYMLQTYAIAHGSLLIMPPLFMLLGLVPEVMILIAIYGWGMSFRANKARSKRE